MSNRRNTFIFIICYLAYTAVYINRLNLSIASPALLASAILSKTQIGLLGSVFSLVFSVGRLVNGYISDRKSPKFMLVLGLSAVGVSNIIIGITPSFGSMLVLWSVNAYAQSMLWSSLLRIISAAYPLEIAKKKSSLLVTSVAVGNIAGILVNTFLVNSFGMQYAFLIPGVTTLIFGYLIFLVVPKTTVILREQQKQNSLRVLLSNKQMKKMLLPTLFHGVMKDNISLWMTVYFIEIYQINLAESASYVLLIPILGFAGRMSYLFLSKLCGYDEQKLSAYCFMVCTVAAFLLCCGKLPIYLALFCLSIIYAAVSVANTAFVSIFPLRFTESGNVAFVSGIMDFITYAGAGISSWIYGLLIEYTGFSAMYLSWAIISVLSVFLLLQTNQFAHSKNSKNRG